MVSTTLHEQVAEFLNVKRRQTRPRKLSVHTYRQYEDVLLRVFSPWAEDQRIKTVEGVRDRVMDRFADHLESEQRGLSRESVRTYLRPVKMFLKWAGVPNGEFRQPEPDHSIMIEPLTHGEVEAMLGKCTHERDRLIIKVLLVTGLRISELLGLRSIDLVDDKHFRETFIRVRGKTGPRQVPMPKDLFRELKSYAEREDNDCIFMAKNGKAPLTRNGAFQLIDNLALEAKVHRDSPGKSSGVHPHLFRHTMATNWLREGRDPVALMNILGHRSMKMIMEIYAHLNSRDHYREMIRVVS